MVQLSDVRHVPPRQRAAGSSWRREVIGIARTALVALAGTALLAQTAPAQLTERQVEASLGLLPAEARTGAAILIPREDGLELFREGMNGWTCWIWLPQDRLAANCHHRVLAGKKELELRLSREGLSGSTVRERLARALESGRLSIPSGSVEISGSGALEDGAEVPDVMQGYYFVYYPFETAKTMGIPGEDPGEGRPWFHHGGTADAHIMWPRSHETRHR
jgi:hypothetical protein